jgi:type IV secretory pathway component VirB8
MLDLFKTVFKYKENKSPDQLGKYPEAIHTLAFPERRYLWTTRLLVIFSCISICLNLMLVSGIYLMLPQRSAYPLLFYHDKTFSQLSVLEKHEKPIAAIDLLTESFIEEYVYLRHVITSDYDELMLRWGPGSKFYWMSSRATYGAFASNDIERNVRDFQMTGITRLVEIEWIRPTSRGFWQVQFITMDYYPKEKNPIINIWHAYIRTVMSPIPYENKSLREQNPFGFLVTNYALSYIGTPGDPKSYLNTAKEVRQELYEY